MTSSLLFCCVGWCLLLNNIILSLSLSLSLSLCLSLLVAVIGADVIDPAGSGNNVTECANEVVSVQLNFRTNVRKAPGRSCVITYRTADITAIGK